MTKVALVLVPHPDDAEWHAGGLIASLVQGHTRVIIVIATDGRCGSLDLDSETLVAVRREEALRAAKVLGVEELIFLDHPDFGVDRLPSGLLREQFIRIIRKNKPDVVIAEDPYAPIEIHPDHRAVAWAAADAIQFANLPLVHPEHLAEGLAPHFVTEKYYYSEYGNHFNKIVDITPTIQIRLAAMLEHRSQVEFMVKEIMMQAQLAGINPEEKFGQAMLDPNEAIKYAISVRAAELGKQIGVQFAEGYRYERFHPLIESLL